MFYTKTMIQKSGINKNSTLIGHGMHKEASLMSPSDQSEASVNCSQLKPFSYFMIFMTTVSHCGTVSNIVNTPQTA